MFLDKQRMFLDKQRGYIMIDDEVITFVEGETKTIE